ncbi:unnamed protein product [Lampetra fluviatilis]
MCRVEHEGKIASRCADLSLASAFRLSRSSPHAVSSSSCSHRQPQAAHIILALLQLSLFISSTLRPFQTSSFTSILFCVKPPPTSSSSSSTSFSLDEESQTHEAVGGFVVVRAMPLLRPPPPLLLLRLKGDGFLYPTASSPSQPPTHDPFSAPRDDYPRCRGLIAAPKRLSEAAAAAEPSL